MLAPRRERLHPQNSPPDFSTWSDSEVEAEFLDVANVRIRYLDFRAFEDTDKLSLYAHYKQGTVGDASDRATPLDDKGAIKNLFWKSLQGMSRADAQRNYLATYHRLHRQLHGEDELPRIQELLLDTVIETRHRKQWLREGYARQSLIPFKTEYFTTLYPDQLSPEMAAEYASKVGVRYKHTIAQRYLIDLRATRPPTPVNDARFQFFLTGTSYSKLMFPLSSLERSKQLPYLELFGLSGDSGDIHLIDTTPVHALPIQPESGCHLGPAVICLVRDPATRQLRPTAIALENINAVEHFPPRVSFPETLKTLHVVHPDHGLAWELAKLYALQGVDYVLGLGKHVVLHVALMTPIALALQDTLRQCGAHSHAGMMAEATHPRIRQPIDFADRSRDPAHIHTRVGALNTLSDRSKYYLLNEITKKDIPVKTYGDLFFKEGGYLGGREHGRKEALRGLEQRFAARMTELCAASGSDHVEFCGIATSIQF